MVPVSGCHKLHFGALFRDECAHAEHNDGRVQDVEEAVLLQALNKVKLHALQQVHDHRALALGNHGAGCHTVAAQVGCDTQKQLRGQQRPTRIGGHRTACTRWGGWHTVTCKCPPWAHHWLDDQGGCKGLLHHHRRCHHRHHQQRHQRLHPHPHPHRHHCQYHQPCYAWLLRIMQSLHLCWLHLLLLCLMLCGHWCRVERQTCTAGRDWTLVTAAGVTGRDT